jgi:DNA polymerase III epsilon subunit-like protein
MDCRMTKTYSGLVHLNGNVMAAVDFETTGRRAGFHEPIQIAIVALDSELRPLTGVRPFYHEIKPKYPERAEGDASSVHKIDLEQLRLHAASADRIADLLIEWWEKLDLPFEKKLVPLAHNWPFENSFFRAWLGSDLTDKLFHGHARDAMSYAISLNDRAAFKGEPVPFPKVGLGSLCKRFKVINAQPHDAMCDALAEAELYRNMLHYDLAA